MAGYNNSQAVEDVDYSGAEDESSAVPGSLQTTELIRLVRTTAGRDLYVGSVAKCALSQSNWGGLLAAAPDALGRLGQCFILASDPLAASLILPQSTDLKYNSLRANLGYCSDLGRNTFRDAEARMKKISMAARAVCEQDGTIDMILEAVEDDDLVEIDLPEQLAILKRVSQSCTQDTMAIRANVNKWGEYANAIHRACMEKDVGSPHISGSVPVMLTSVDDLGNKDKELDDEIELQGECVKMKHAQVEESKQQTEHYRARVQSWGHECTQADKSYKDGVWVDIGITAAETAVAAVSAIKSAFGPWGTLLYLGFTRSLSSYSSSEGYDVTDSNDPPEQEDRNYTAANLLIPIVQKLAKLLAIGPDELSGVDWDTLSGRSGRHDNIQHILIEIRGLPRRFVDDLKPISMQVLNAAKSVEEVALDIQGVINSEGDVDYETSTVAERGPTWRNQVRRAETVICGIIAAALNAAKEANAQMQGKKQHPRLSRAERRFQRLRMAQQARLEAEIQLNNRLEEESRMTQEFNSMQLKLEQLLISKATMDQVKEIVAECVKHLQGFREKLDELGSFFTQLQDFIEDMDRSRVDPFSTMATTTKSLGDRAKNEVSEAAKARRDEVMKKKLQTLKLKALELKGYYLVAGAMADTYVEVSANHIIPAVREVDKLGLPEAKSLSKEQRAANITVVGNYAKEARQNVKRLANARKAELLNAMTVDRGDVEEILELEQ